MGLSGKHLSSANATIGDGRMSAISSISIHNEPSSEAEMPMSSAEKDKKELDAIRQKSQPHATPQFPAEASSTSMDAFWAHEINAANAHLNDRENKYDSYALNEWKEGCKNLDVVAVADVLRYGLDDIKPEWVEHFRQASERSPHVLHLFRILDPVKEAVQRNPVLDAMDISAKMVLNLKYAMLLRRKQWLNGTVIDAYTTVLNKVAEAADASTVFLSSISTGFIFTSFNDPGTVRMNIIQKSGAKKFILAEAFKHYDRVVIPVNIKDSHWATMLLVKASGNACHCYYYDSLNWAWEAKMKARLEQALAPTKVTFLVGKCPQQTGGNNCGVCVCRNMQYLLMEETVADVIAYDIKAIDDFRLLILSRILCSLKR
jgi:hypothetical protein